MKALAHTSKTTRLYALMVLLFAGYAMLRVSNLAQATEKVKETADTTAYVRISKASVSGIDILAGSRPPVFPLLLKILGGNPEQTARAQGIFSIVSWGLLAFSVASSIHTTLLRLAAFGLILLLSLYRYIIGWDSVLLTESLSLSLMALFLAAWLWLTRGWRWHRAAWVLIAGCFWAFCRDTNAWVVLMIGLFLLLLVALRLADRRYLALAGAFAAMFLFSNLSADTGGRWIFPFQNVLGQRILPNARAVEFFAGCGMPVSPALLQLRGEFASGQERAFYEDPALAEYRLWLHRSGKSCYVKWLLSDPWASFRAPAAEFDTLISLEKVQPFLFSRRFSPVLPARLEAVLYPPRYLLPVLAVMLVILSVALLSRAWKQNKAWGPIAGALLLLLPHYFITWHGDIMGIYRHVLTASLQFYLSLWLLLLFGLDAILSLQRVRARFPGSFSLTGAKQSGNETYRHL